MVWNRSDCCKERLSNSKLQILDNSRKVVIQKSIGDASNINKFEFIYDNVVGKFVRIQIEGSDKYLSLAEVQVFGSYKPNKYAYGPTLNENVVNY